MTATATIKRLYSPDTIEVRDMFLLMNLCMLYDEEDFFDRTCTVVMDAIMINIARQTTLHVVILRPMRLA